MARRALKAVIRTEPIRLDLGCGKNKKEGFLGVDRRKFEGVDVVQDLLKPWQWKDDTVAEIHMSHALEHFSGRERVFIFNEMYRVMQTGAKATIITPHWCSNRAYGDFTHQWPPVSEMAYYYISKKWRLENAPDTDIQWNPEGYSCDFQATAGYSSIHPGLQSRNDEAKQFAFAYYKEAAGDMIATLVKV
jgi:hypothetical protein